MKGAVILLIAVLIDISLAVGTCPNPYKVATGSDCHTCKTEAAGGANDKFNYATQACVSTCPAGTTALKVCTATGAGAVTTVQPGACPAPYVLKSGDPTKCVTCVAQPGTGSGATIYDLRTGTCIATGGCGTGFEETDFCAAADGISVPCPLPLISKNNDNGKCTSCTGQPAGTGKTTFDTATRTCITPAACAGNAGFEETKACTLNVANAPTIANAAKTASGTCPIPYVTKSDDATKCVSCKVQPPTAGQITFNPGSGACVNTAACTAISNHEESSVCTSTTSVTNPGSTDASKVGLSILTLLSLLYLTLA